MRTLFIQLRVSLEDKAVLEAAARVRGISLSDFIRQAALDATRAMKQSQIDAIRKDLREGRAI